MNMRLSHALPLLLLLAACVPAPKPTPAAAAPKEVALDDQAQYWLLDHDSIPNDVPVENGCFRVKAVIGSDGKIADHKVLAEVGHKIAAWLPGFLAQLRFDPAPENPAKTPISTTLTWTLREAVTTTSVSPASAAAAVRAAVAEGPPPDTLNWKAHCEAEMDKQMGITPGP
jgi:hypothetical protein